MTNESHSSIGGHGVTAVTEYLRGKGIAHEVVEHTETTSAVAEATATGRPQEQVAKTIVLHDGAAYLLAVIPASHRLSLPKLREVLGATKALRLATEAEMADDFPGLDVGAVPPLGPILPIAEAVDRRLLDHDRVLCAAGDHRHSLLLAPGDIVAATSATVADVSDD